MARERLAFADRARPAADPRRVRSMAAVLLLVGLALFFRAAWTPSVPAGVPVRVDGDVPSPGIYLLTRPTVREAVRAAGGDPLLVQTDAPVSGGQRVEVRAGEARVLPARTTLLVGLPVNVNDAPAESLLAIPGVSRRQVDAIIAYRQENGPFHDLAELRRVPGLGGRFAESLDGLLTVGEIAPRGPVNVNTATAEELDLLPGIGPVLAARIVVDRADAGPYPSLDALTRVRGITASTVDGLRTLATAESP